MDDGWIENNVLFIVTVRWTRLSVQLANEIRRASENSLNDCNSSDVTKASVNPIVTTPLRLIQFDPEKCPALTKFTDIQRVPSMRLVYKDMIDEGGYK